jgi:hypothetical protein
MAIPLEREMESLRPIDYDELHEAADLIRHFRSYWDQCADMDEPEEARQQLLAKIVEQVFVYDDHVVAIALHGDFNIVLEDDETMPVEIAEVLGEKIDARHSEMTRGRSGSDGRRILLFHLWIVLARSGRVFDVFGLFLDPDSLVGRPNGLTLYGPGTGVATSGSRDSIINV